MKFLWVDPRICDDGEKAAIFAAARMAIASDGRQDDDETGLLLELRRFLGIPNETSARIAEDLRAGTIRIRFPGSSAGRKAMFESFLQAAASDHRISVAERRIASEIGRRLGLSERDMGYWLCFYFGTDSEPETGRRHPRPAVRDLSALDWQEEIREITEDLAGEIHELLAAFRLVRLRRRNFGALADLIFGVLATLALGAWSAAGVLYLGWEFRTVAVLFWTEIPAALLFFLGKSTTSILLSNCPNDEARRGFCASGITFLVVAFPLVIVPLALSERLLGGCELSGLVMPSTITGLAFIVGGHVQSAIRHGLLVRRDGDTHFDAPYFDLSRRVGVTLMILLLAAGLACADQRMAAGFLVVVRTVFDLVWIARERRRSG